MNDIERCYFMALGAIQQRIVYYAERSDELISSEGPGSVRGLFYLHKAEALQEALNILEVEE